MLKTFLVTRPYAIFDAANAEHRRAYNHFLKTNSWADCPYQFVCEHPYVELPANINYRLMEYYMGLEFKKAKTRVRIK